MSKIPVVLLLGSGCSQAVGMTRTDDITDRVLNLNWKNTQDANGIWHYEKRPETDKDSQREQNLLRFLDNVVTRYYGRFGQSVKSNYEELAYLAGQLEDGLGPDSIPEVDNPGIDPLAREVATSPQGLEAKLTGDLISELAGEARHMIYDVTWQSLISKPKRKLSRLRLILEMADDSDLSGCDVFTLNHDLVLEQLFEENKIEFSDGFVRHDRSSWGEWSLDGNKKENPKIRLYKLHGSVNWLEYAKKLYAAPTSDIVDGRVPIPMLTRPDKEEYPDDGRPRILVGRFDKELRYTEPKFLEMQYRLMQTLEKVSVTVIVVCGYSFGDRGVNRQVANWLETKEDARIVIIDPDKNGLEAGARGVIRKKWVDWKQRKKLKVIEMGVEKLKWEDLKKAIQDGRR